MNCEKGRILYACDDNDSDFDFIHLLRLSRAILHITGVHWHTCRSRCDGAVILRSLPSIDIR